MEGETNISTVLQLLKEIKADVESLKRDHQRRDQCSRQQSSDGTGGDELSGHQETVQRNHLHRLYSYQGRDDLGLHLGRIKRMERGELRWVGGDCRNSLNLIEGFSSSIISDHAN